MQWRPIGTRDFPADPQRLYLPPIMDAVYGYQSVNVEAQLRSSSSLLHWTRRLIATRANYRAFGRGTLTFLEPGNRKVIAYLREYENEAMLCVANLSRVPQAVELDLARFEQRVPVEIMGKAPRADRKIAIPSDVGRARIFCVPVVGRRETSCVA